MKSKTKLLIGIIDSGIGGLAVLKRLLNTQIESDFIYFADNEFMPYGNKTTVEIGNRVQQIINMLFNKYKVEKVIVACNTASTCLKNQPEVIKMQFNKCETYLTTKRTKLNLTGYNCIDAGNLASIIETNILQPAKLKKYLKNLKLNKQNLKTITLGCTHFELILPIFKQCYKGIDFKLNSECVVNQIHFKNAKTKGEYSPNVYVLTSKNDKHYVDLIYELIKQFTNKV